MSSPTEESVRRNSETDCGEPETPEHDPHFDPIVSLPLVDIQTNEEEEEELTKIRARLYRYDTGDHEWKMPKGDYKPLASGSCPGRRDFLRVVALCAPPPATPFGVFHINGTLPVFLIDKTRYNRNEERGTGDIKLLRHKINNTVRVVMRRDKTLKVCANHFITPDIRMNIHCGSDKAFNWSVFADYADETCKQELLAIKFGNPQNAELWKSKFAEAQEIVRTKCSLYTQDQSSDDESSITRSEDTDTPEPKSTDNKSSELKEVISEDKDSDGVVLKLKELKVECEKSE